MEGKEERRKGRKGRKVVAEAEEIGDTYIKE